MSGATFEEMKNLLEDKEESERILMIYRQKPEEKPHQSCKGIITEEEWRWLAGEGITHFISRNGKPATHLKMRKKKNGS